MIDSIIDRELHKQDQEEAWQEYFHKLAAEKLNNMISEAITAKPDQLAALLSTALQEHPHLYIELALALRTGALSELYSTLAEMIYEDLP